MTGKMITILLIEDNPGDVRLIREYLAEGTSASLALEHAARLATGLERLAAGGIDVVLLDLSLPDSQGFDTFHQAYARSPHVPIIVLTALDDEAVAVETLNAGGQDYLIKTYLNYSTLHRSISYAIERKRAAEELHRAKEAAEAANRAKDQFLAVLSHELRTPLTPVLLAVSALLDDPDTDADLLPTLSMIRRQVELEARLIDDLLDVTLIAQGKMRFKRETVDAHASIHQSLDLCRGDLDAGRFQVMVDLSAAAHHVAADPVRLQQVFGNLLKNAIKFTPMGGTIALRSRNQPGPSPDRPHLVIEISDSGIGIAPEVLPRIFRAFEQGEAPLRRRFGGLGLGLAISRSVVEAHGGRLSAVSAGQGRGTTLILELATVPEPVAAPPAPDAAPPRRPLKILLVEDNPDTLLTLTRLLSQQRHTVRAVARLSSAREAAAEGGFDLVLSDIQLPDGTGLELMRELVRGRDVPGIAFSGFGSEEDIRQSQAAGFAAHLIKPIDACTLEATIARIVPGAGV